MEPLSNNIQLPSLQNPAANNNDLTISGAGTNDYEPLLYKIATSFGYSDSETMDLVQQVCSCCNAYCTDGQYDGSLKISLSKVMVHKCIFKLSSQLFSQQTDTKTTCVTDMPLSVRSVFILHDMIGFNECEVAELLHTNLLQVKQRHNKALSFINNQQY